MANKNRTRVDILPTPMIPGGDTSSMRDALTEESEYIRNEIASLSSASHTDDVIARGRIERLEYRLGLVEFSIAGLHDNVVYFDNKARYDALRQTDGWLAENAGRWVLVKTGCDPVVYETQQDAMWHARWNDHSDQNAYIGRIE